MQHRITLSKTLLIAIKNKKTESEPVIKAESPSRIRPRSENLQKRYVRYATLAGLTRIRVEEIY